MQVPHAFPSGEQTDFPGVGHVPVVVVPVIGARAAGETEGVAGAVAWGTDGIVDGVVTGIVGGVVTGIVTEVGGTDGGGAEPEFAPAAA